MDIFVEQPGQRGAFRKVKSPDDFSGSIVMVRALTGTVLFVGSLVIVMVAGPLLWWLGRPSEEYRGELVVDDVFDDEMDFDFDDLGMDVDD